MQTPVERPSFSATLGVKPFRNLWLAQVISQIALNMLVFVLGVVMYQKTASNTAVSVLYLAVGLPAAVFGLISGVYVDRFDKKMLLIATTIVRLVLTAAILLFNFEPLPIYLLVIAISAVSQLFIPAEAALIPVFVEESRLISANSLFTLTFYSAIIGGFVAGGPLLAALGSVLTIWFVVGLFVLATIFLLMLPQPKTTIAVRSHVTFSSALSDIKFCFTYIRKSILVGHAIFLMTLSQTIIAIFATLAPGFADHLLSVRLTDASVIILGPAALGMIIGAVMIGNIALRFAKRQLVTFGILLSGLLLLLVVFLISLPNRDPVARFFMENFHMHVRTAVVPVAIMTFFLLGFANSLIDVTCNTVIQEHTTEEVRGKVYGLLASLVGGVAVVPVIITGLIADVFGIGRIIFVMGALLIGVGVVMSRTIMVNDPNKEELFDT